MDAAYTPHLIALFCGLGLLVAAGAYGLQKLFPPSENPVTHPERSPSEGSTLDIAQTIANVHAHTETLIQARIDQLVTDATYVKRTELLPLVAAYCRKSLDDGELRARVLALVADDLGVNNPDLGAPPLDINVALQAAKATNDRLHELARKRARPVKSAKRRPK